MSSASTPTDSATTEQPQQTGDPEVDPYLQMVLAAQSFLQQHQKAMVGDLGSRVNYMTSRDPIIVDTRIDEDLRPLFDAGQGLLAVSLQGLRELKKIATALESASQPSESASNEEA